MDKLAILLKASKLKNSFPEIANRFINGGIMKGGQELSRLLADDDFDKNSIGYQTGNIMLNNLFPDEEEPVNESGIIASGNPLNGLAEAVLKNMKNEQAPVSSIANTKPVSGSQTPKNEKNGSINILKSIIDNSGQKQNKTISYSSGNSGASTGVNISDALNQVENFVSENSPYPRYNPDINQQIEGDRVQNRLKRNRYENAMDMSPAEQLKDGMLASMFGRKTLKWNEDIPFTDAEFNAKNRSSTMATQKAADDKEKGKREIASNILTVLMANKANKDNQKYSAEQNRLGREYEAEQNRLGRDYASKQEAESRKYNTDANTEAKSQEMKGGILVAMQNHRQKAYEEWMAILKQDPKTARMDPASLRQTAQQKADEEIDTFWSPRLKQLGF